MVNFAAPSRNERLVKYNFENVSESNAVALAQIWCDEMNKVVYGKYSYLSHDVASKQFKVRFEPTPRKQQ